jgi:LuxR family maltose regulon positive regulatory protein
VAPEPRPLLETKLYAPQPRRGAVPRPRLSDRLDRGTESKLTLISAPAGFGKTTLVAEWLAATSADERRVAWLSLDESDNEPASFWTYVVRALRQAAPAVGASALSLLGGGQPSTEAVVTTLLNDIRAVPGDIALVVDDYHVIEAPEIHGGMAFLLDHLPQQLHLVLTTRADPPLPLARLRARGELVEIRAADLRFTSDEVATYLNGAMGLALTPGDVDALESRTEGWIAALQLAALTMQGRTDIAGFIAGFAGDDRYIVDYLVEEVLRRQPDQVRSFLLRTSILAGMSGPLVDKLTGVEGGRATLEALDRANLFLVPLDDQRRWYRYHHLFADVLRARLMDERPEEVAGLHRRASEWYEQDGDRSEAIRHALAGGDAGRAAALVELAVPDLRRSRQEALMRRWFEALPKDIFEARPVLAMGYVGALMSTGELAGVEALLEIVERWLDTPPADHRQPNDRPAGMIVVDEAELPRLPGALVMYRAGLARLAGDVAGTMVHARRALEVVPEDDHLVRGAAASLLALAHWTNGDLDAAYRWYAEGMADLEKAGHLADRVSGAITLADLRIAQGRLHDAMRAYERGLELAMAHGEPPLRGAADMHVGMSDVFRERNDLAAATLHLRASRDLGEDNDMPQNPHRWRVVAGRIRQAEGDLGGALELLADAEQRYAGDFTPESRPIAAVIARVRIARGELSEARGWARDRGLTIKDELDYLHEFEHATLARLLLAEGTRDRAEHGIDEAIELTDRLVAAADDGRRQGSVLDVLVVQALARHARGDTAGALTSLARVVALAEPEGYARLFLDEGPPMAALLKLASRQRDAPEYVRRLAAAAVTNDRGGVIEQALIEPLSERELEVLRLLGSELDGPDIARELVVSLNTVRSHTKNIYAKLGVNSRRAAVRRAAELGLLTYQRDRRPTA